MSVFGVYGLLVIVLLLVVLSAFFSASETGMMALNRYRLRHLAKQGDPKALRVSKLLQRPDRLLGIILIGNTLCNVLASAVMTYLVITFVPEINMFVVSLGLTLILLVFAETAPKTLAALYPQKVAFFVSAILKFLLKMFYPFVILVNGVANFLLRCFRVNVTGKGHDSMSAAELRSVVLDVKGKIAPNYQQMLLRILELERVTVADVLVPRSEIYGIDLDDEWDIIRTRLVECPHTHLVVYRGDIDHVHGMLNLRKVSRLLLQPTMEVEDLLAMCEAPYFVPEGAQLNRQLLNFQDQQRSVGLVVDEYGDMVGLVTLRDIVEEIVGEFVFNAEEDTTDIKTRKDGSVLVGGRMSLRELNRQTGWQLPVDGPRTLSGLIVEHLEMIPQLGIGCRIAGYPIEVIEVEGNIVRLARIWPELALPEIESFE